MHMEREKLKAEEQANAAAQRALEEEREALKQEMETQEAEEAKKIELERERDIEEERKKVLEEFDAMKARAMAKAEKDDVEPEIYGSEEMEEEIQVATKSLHRSPSVANSFLSWADSRFLKNNGLFALNSSNCGQSKIQCHSESRTRVSECKRQCKQQDWVTQTS